MHLKGIWNEDFSLIMSCFHFCTFLNYFHFSLLNGLIKQTYPMNGSLTDLNIWDRRLTQSEIRKLTQCNSYEFGRTVSWEDMKLGIKI